MSLLNVLPEEVWHIVNYFYMRNIGLDEFAMKISFVNLEIISITQEVYDFLQSHDCKNNENIICQYIYKKKIKLALCRTNCLKNCGK